jgi:ABC-type antimicrobial peptide transport system permease subunit
MGYLFFISAWRNLAKTKLNTVVNLVGLFVAFTISILLLLTVYHEFSFDGFHANSRDLYKVYSVSFTAQEDRVSTSMAYPVAPALKREVPGIILTTPFMPGGGAIRYGDNEFSQNIRLVSSDFFSMFSFKILSGNAQAPLANKYDIVLSKSSAAALFGRENPIGKIVKANIGGTSNDLTVSAIIDDAPANSTLKYDALTNIALNSDYAERQDNWNIQNHTVYVQIDKNVTKDFVEEKLRPVIRKYLESNADAPKDFRKDSFGDFVVFKLAPMASLHFDSAIGPRNASNKTYMYGMLLIAITVVFIACFNFINLSIATAFTRSKEIGIRKANGAAKKQIFFLLWLESFLLFMTALLMSLLSSTLLLSYFSNLIEIALDARNLLEPVFLSYILLGALGVSFLAGGYPAWIISGFRVVESLKGDQRQGRAGIFRYGSVAFQFFLASLLISYTLVIYQQMQFLTHAPLGFDQESVISIPVQQKQNSQKNINRLREKLASNPDVLAISATSSNLGIGEDGNQNTSTSSFIFNDKTITTEILLVDNDILKTLNISPLAGRDFSRLYPADTSMSIINIIITKSVADQFGLPDVNGVSFYPSANQSGPKFNITGVIPDLHLHSLHQKVTPVTLMMARSNPLGYILVNVKTANPVETMRMVSQAYHEIDPSNEVSMSYLSENTQRWYLKEKKFSTLFTYSTLVALILSCLGLFAITSLDMQKRYKEIGIRKVLGASTLSIHNLIIINFMKYVFAAFFLSVPFAWLVVNKWLENFAYRVNMNWWMICSGGVFLMLLALVTISFQTTRAASVNPVESLKAE